VQAALDRSLYRRAGRLIMASQSLAEELAAEGLPEASMRVVPPGRDLPSPPDSPLPDLRLGRQVALLSVGNWVPHKGLLDLLEVLARLPPSAATLHLVGRDDADPPYAERVRSRLAVPDVAGRVVVHGPLSRERLAVLYRAADVFVLPSRQEAYGTVYGEAMAAGLPVAGWRAGNLANLAADGREGVVVEPGDIDALTAGLRRLADDEGLRAGMAAAAGARGRSLPTWQDSATAFFETLRELVGLRAGRPR
jgi:glycosyltransferase involved in cell wall biosynthesis